MPSEDVLEGIYAYSPTPNMHYLRQIIRILITLVKKEEEEIILISDEEEDTKENLTLETIKAIYEIVSSKLNYSKFEDTSHAMYFSRLLL